MLLAWAFVPPAGAQPLPPEISDRLQQLEGSLLPDRPGQGEPGQPDLDQPEQPPPGFVLPPLPSPDAREGERLSRAPRVRVREFRVLGSSVFSDAELAVVTAPYLERPLGTEDLQRLRDELTLLYVNAGYVNSGAVLPDQDVSDGVVEYRIVEGELTEIELTGQRYFREGYLRRRLERAARVPLDVQELEQQLQLLQQDPRIRRVDAELRPGAVPGEGRLSVRFQENRPWHFRVELDNHRSANIGAEQARVIISNDNLVGLGDTLTLIAGQTEGLDDWEASYEIPLNRWDTTLGFRYRYSNAEVVEHPFDEIDIESRSFTYGVSLRQPVLRTLRNDVSVSLTAELRESRTYLLDRRFSFSEGAENGKTRVSVLRFGQDWVYRDRSQVLAARSTVSWGVDLLDATVHGGSTEDGLFFAWLGQLQWTRRFDRLWGVQLLFRSDVQLATSALLSLEQFSVGGYRTVRGYRENQLVRDNGLASSIEVRVPLWRDSLGRPVVQLAPFADIGRSWNTKRTEPKPRTLYSVGVGLRWSITQRARFEIYWGEALRDVATPDDRDLTDTGVHFGMVFDFF